LETRASEEKISMCVSTGNFRGRRIPLTRSKRKTRD